MGDTNHIFLSNYNHNSFLWILSFDFLWCFGCIEGNIFVMYKERCLWSVCIVKLLIAGKTGISLNVLLFYFLCKIFSVILFVKYNVQFPLFVISKPRKWEALNWKPRKWDALNIKLKRVFTVVNNYFSWHILD